MATNREEGQGEMYKVARPKNAQKSGYVVTDHSSLHRYRTEIPNVIEEMDLSVYAFRLYIRLKRVAGDDGKCYHSTRELAEQCNMSVGMVSKAKIELVGAKLITIERDGKWDRDNIRIVDIWPANFAYFADKPVAPACSPHEQEAPPVCSPHEQPVHHMNAPVHHMNAIKEEPIKEEPIKEEPKKKSSSSSASSSEPPEKKKDDDDDLAFNGVLTAWNDGMPEKATNHIRRKLKELIGECGPDAVIGGILAAVEAGGRSFKYVATCTRNGVAGTAGDPDAAHRAKYSEYNHLLKPLDHEAQP